MSGYCATFKSIEKVGERKGARCFFNPLDIGGEAISLISVLRRSQRLRYKASSETSRKMVFLKFTAEVVAKDLFDYVN